MITSINGVVPQTYNNFIDNGVGTGARAISLADGWWRQSQAIYISNDDTIPHVIEIQLDDGSISPSLGSITVPAGAGHSGALASEFISSALPTGQQGIDIAAGYRLVALTTVAVTSGKHVYIANQMIRCP